MILAIDSNGIRTMIDRSLSDVGIEDAIGHAGDVVAVGIVDIAHAPGGGRVIAEYPVVGEVIIIVARINDPGQTELLHVIDTLGGARLFLGFGKDRQEQRRENCDNSDDDEQFD